MKASTSILIAGFTVAGALLARPGTCGDPTSPTLENLTRRLNDLEHKVGDLADAVLVPSEFTYTQDIAVRELLVAARDTRAAIRASVVGGVPSLLLADSTGRVRISLSASAFAPVIALHDSQGRPRAALAVTENGIGVAQTFDAKGGIVGRLGLPLPQPGIGSPTDDPKAADLLAKLREAEKARIGAEALVESFRSRKDRPEAIARVADEARAAREREAQARILFEQYVTVGAR